MFGIYARRQCAYSPRRCVLPHLISGQRIERCAAPEHARRIHQRDVRGACSGTRAEGAAAEGEVISMLFKFSLLVLLIGTLSGCMAPRLQTFNPADYRSSLEDGTATITGEAFLTTRGGGIRPGAGRLVQLLPVTPYTTEVFEREFLNHERLTPPIDKRLDRYARFITADSRGEFIFERVPAGSYYLVCSIYWDVSRVDQFNQDDEYDEETGAAALGHVTVGDGETKRIVVTR